LLKAFFIAAAHPAGGFLILGGIKWLKNLWTAFFEQEEKDNVSRSGSKRRNAGEKERDDAQSLKEIEKLKIEDRQIGENS